MRRELHFGDNLDVLRDRARFPDASVDLVYLDPPFNSNASYNMLFKDKTGEKAEAQIQAFDDTWTWGITAEEAFDDVVIRGANLKAAQLLKALRSFLGDNDIMAYVAMMAVRLLELHRVLKDTGSLYLHCDPTASHYLKLVLDAVFGHAAMSNEVIWKRTFSHGSAKRYGPIHDTIFFYRKSDKFTWTNPKATHDDAYILKHFTVLDPDRQELYQPISLTGAGTRKGESGSPWRETDPTTVGRHWALPRAVLEKEGITTGTTQEKLDQLDAMGRIHWGRGPLSVPRLKWFVSDLDGVAIGDVFVDIPPLTAQSKERLGYPTQKPLALLERIISASSNPGDVVLDPFCGCGTAVHAAEKLGRQWVGIDVTHLAINLIERRMRDAFPKLKEKGAYQVYGTPTTWDAAERLAMERPDQFEKWAVSRIPGAREFRLHGADGGIDGIVNFKEDKATYRRIIISVKGGRNIGVGMVRDLKGVLDREGDAAMGLLVCLHEPTKPMVTEAANAGFYNQGARRLPKLQIVTIRDLLDGKLPALPALIDESATFKAAPKEADDDGQGQLL